MTQAKTKKPQEIRYPGSVIESVPAIKIGPVVWAVQELTTELDKLYGSCSAVEHHTISINRINETDAAKSEQMDTVLHEILHAINYTYFGSIRTLSEQQVSMVAHALEHLLLDNPRLLAWLVLYSSWQRAQRQKTAVRKGRAGGAQ